MLLCVPKRRGQELPRWQEEGGINFPETGAAGGKRTLSSVWVLTLGLKIWHKREALAKGVTDIEETQAYKTKESRDYLKH